MNRTHVLNKRSIKKNEANLSVRDQHSPPIGVVIQCHAAQPVVAVAASDLYSLGKPVNLLGHF